jgi:UDP-2,4-diacetamido-2,4,6-trideoxy-beta-L-altropyranose hydrolase
MPASAPQTAGPRLLFRVDTDAAAGRHRLARCLAIADEWPGRCAFASAVVDTGGEALLRSAGVGLVQLRAATPEGRCAELVREAERHGVGGLVLDSDEIDARAEATVLASGLPVLRLDDGAEHNPYRSHRLLNCRWGAEAVTYATAGRTVRLLGPAYYPLRRELRDLARGRDATGHVARVLVLLQAGDPAGLASRMLQRLEHSGRPGLRVRLVLGSNAPEDLARLAARSCHDVSLDAMPGSLAPYLRAADVAIVASASSAYDLAATGVPVLMCSARAGSDEARGLAASGAGLTSSLEAGAPEDALTELLALDGTRRRAMGEAGRAAVDGAGSARVCRSLLDVTA